MRIVVISDTHIGGKFNEEMFYKGIDEVNKIEADYIIHCGDLTDEGTVAHYELANEYFKRLKKPFFIVPGNHDSKNVGDLLYEEYIGPRYFAHVDDQKKVKLLGLDSTEPDRNTGRLGERAIQRIYEEFNDLEDDWHKILVFHHQTLPIPYTGRERSACVDGGDAIRAILDCNVDLVLNGHRHISNVFRLTDGDVNALIVNVGTLSCKKTRYREEYSLTVIDYDNDFNDAQVQVVLLNRDPIKWTTKFQSTVRNLEPPTILDEPSAMIVQIANSEFSEGRFDQDIYLKATVKINSLDCDVVLHNGDITGHSYSAEFVKAAELLRIIDKPLLTLPGPRDSYPLGWELYRKYFANPNPIFENERLKLACFDTCLLDEREGRLGRSNSHKIVDELSGISKLTAVGFHHTIVPLPKSRHEAELTDAGDVLAMLTRQKIDLVLTAAKNRAACWQIDDTVFVNAGTICSHNLATSDGNSFNIIRVYDTDAGRWFEVNEFLIEAGIERKIGGFHVRRR